VVSEGIYRPVRVEVMLTRNAAIQSGEYLLAELNGKIVVLQSKGVFVKRQTSSYDEKLVMDGVIKEDGDAWL
jgi:hypothetical protein